MRGSVSSVNVWAPSTAQHSMQDRGTNQPGGLPPLALPTPLCISDLLHPNTHGWVNIGRQGGKRGGIVRQGGSWLSKLLLSFTDSNSQTTALTVYIAWLFYYFSNIYPATRYTSLSCQCCNSRGATSPQFIPPPSYLHTHPSTPIPSPPWLCSSTTAHRHTHSLQTPSVECLATAFADRPDKVIVEAAGAGWGCPNTPEKTNNSNPNSCVQLPCTSGLPAAPRLSLVAFYIDLNLQSEQQGPHCL